jgi:head-tail adaptor
VLQDVFQATKAAALRISHASKSPNGFFEDFRVAVRLQSASAHEIDLTSEQFAQMFLQCREAHETDVRLRIEYDKDINVGAGIRVATRGGTEKSGSPNTGAFQRAAVGAEQRQKCLSIWRGFRRSITHAEYYPWSSVLRRRMIVVAE